MTKTRILVVEDESITARDLQLTLQDLGYEVVAKVSTGEDAVRQAEATRPDLVLMDIVMPSEVDGIDAAQQIGARFDIPVVYLTAHTEEGTLSRAKISAPYGYIVKPFNERNLRSNIEMALCKAGMERQLKGNLHGMIDVVNELIKMRDPFLFTHQEKVTRLARAIAEQMGLTPTRIKGVELGARIHGLGLLSIPADILARQNMLTGSHLTLYREYPKSGYDLLKDIDFPWPIATIVLQHRELLDGSGFPDGLKGGAIIQEARIVGLAHAAVEMLAHSYQDMRPTMSVDDMLAKISAGRGTHYDPAAVDVCIRLFREKGFKFE